MKISVTREEDVSPEQVKELLQNWANSNAGTIFPHKPGTFICFAPDLAEALKIDPETPVLVVGRAPGSLIGIVATLSNTGQVTTMSIMPSQVAAS